MSNHISNEILVVGTGPMAIDYVKVLPAIAAPFIVIGRGQTSADVFNQKTGISPIVGGIDLFFNESKGNYSHAIISVGPESLMSCLLTCLRNNVKNILIEKPAAVSISELEQNIEIINSFNASIHIAYNRRFYDSVAVVRQLIQDDGGLKSMTFEFTEWVHKINPLLKNENVLKNWFFANSTHVVDLAFHLAGVPLQLQSYTAKGEIPWHDVSIFAGSGITENGVIFSYHSNWESAGRWGIDLFTNKRKIILRPLEEVQVQMRGSISVEKFDINATNDNLKPGLLNQVKSFLNNDNSFLLNINNHLKMSIEVYRKIIKGYSI